MNNVIHLIMQIAIVLFLANIFRALSAKFKFPPVISLILLGIILGPSLFNYIEKSGTIEWIAQIGILFLLFEAGTQTNLKRIREESQKAVSPALGGVLLPFLGGFFLAYLSHHSLVGSLFIGTIFTATSISISVITLMEINKLQSIEGRTIINSAIIDDIIGILLISLIFGLSVERTTGGTFLQNSVLMAILKIFFFFIIAIVVGLYILPAIFNNSKRLNLESSILSFSVATIFIYSWFAEMSGLAAITGAYFAGLFIGQTEQRHLINTGISQVGKSFFIDFFFIGIGLTLNLRVMPFRPVYLILFFILAILTKFIGSSLGARIAQFDTTRAVRIGFGMIPRGEVALIIASMGLRRGLINIDDLSATVLMVIITSIIAPILIKFSYRKLQKETF